MRFHTRINSCVPSCINRICSIKRLIFLLLCILTVFCTVSMVWAEDQISKSVVKIIATQRLPDIIKLWSKQTQREISGSGVIIEGGRILTNAHVVAFAQQIYIQPYQSADKIEAKVIALSPEIDLALLKIDNKELLNNNSHMVFADKLPKTKDPVSVYGYPMGGSEQSVTEGIVSRIEYQAVFYGVPSLLIQIDAALNPGNSGGAAVAEGKLIGLVCSKIMAAENIGFLIPVEEINMFLKDASDGKYEGQPMIDGIQVQTLENDALRSCLKISEETTGMVVQDVKNIDPEFLLKPWDIITHIGDYPIDNEGRIRVNEDLRLPATYLVPRIAKEGKVPLTIIRNKKQLKLNVPVSVESQKLIRFKGFNYPRYFIYGPLVFVELDQFYIQQLLKTDKMLLLLAAVGSPVITRMSDNISFKDEALVAVFSPMFSNRITKGYDTRGPFGVVSHINDVPIKNLIHLVETLRDNRKEFVVFKFANSRSESLVFKRVEIEAATEDILNENGIRYQFSEDLKDVWNRK
ncbi:MAG: trypsin-like peptidase domain-containing protein [Proteobacteria bacterium]|nr:trypsin-like peptidase domain-containing protein [Pseudomonadota bacterium]